MPQNTDQQAPRTPFQRTSAIANSRSTRLESSSEATTASAYLQRTLGNRASGRIDAQRAKRAIQRSPGGNGGTPLMLADRPWEEIVEEEAKTGKRAQAKQQLMLADRPWGEINEEEAKTGKRAKAKQPLMLADRPWGEINEEEAKTGKRAKANQPLLLADRPWAQIEEEQQLKARLKHNPLMLTDRPWAEIEKENDPATKLFRGDNKDAMGREKKQSGNDPFFRLPREPLALADRPWEEMQHIGNSDYSVLVEKLNSRIFRLMSGREYQLLKEPINAFETKYLKNANAKRRLRQPDARRAALDEIAQLETQAAQAKAQREREDQLARNRRGRKEMRNQAARDFDAKVNAARLEPGGNDYQAKLSAIEQKYNTPTATNLAKGSLNWQKHGNSELFWLRAEHVAAFKRNKALEELQKRRDLLTNGSRGLRERFDAANYDQKLTNRKAYFGPHIPQNVQHNNALAAMQTRLTDIANRVNALRVMGEGIRANPDDSKLVNDANEDLGSTNDTPLIQYNTLVSDYLAAERNVMDIGLLTTARSALLPPYQNPPHLMNATMLNWLQTKTAEHPDLDPAGYHAEIVKRMQLQYLITGGYWLRDILGFNFVVRPGQPTLYILDLGHITLNNKHGGGTTNYNVHLSVFANTITDARISCIDTTASIVDKLIVSDADMLKAAHVTLELWNHGAWPHNWNGNPNSHYYRGGQNAPKALHWKTNDDWTTVVMPLLQNKLTTAIANFQAPVQAVVTNKGDAGFPLPGSLT